MFDRPAAPDIIAEVANALKAGIPAGFEQLVAANALSIAGREIGIGPDLARAEQQRLQVLLGTTGDLPTLRAQLVAAIRDGKLAGKAEALEMHLVRTAIAKMQIDQPGYAAFKAWQASRQTDKKQES